MRLVINDFVKVTDPTHCQYQQVGKVLAVLPNTYRVMFLDPSETESFTAYWLFPAQVTLYK